MNLFRKINPDRHSRANGNPVRTPSLPLFFLAFFLSLYHFTTLPLYSATLVSGALNALDSAGVVRNPPVFNNSERIGFQYNINNSVSKSGSILFTYSLTNPNGVVVFTQQGNSISASQTGAGGTSIFGVPVSQIYSTPGNYTLTGTARYSDNSETVSNTLVIQIFSPILNLIYPPNQTVNLTDQPVVFRWIGTGATKFTVSVSLSATLFNPILTQDVFGASQFTYPQAPSDPRQKLSAGQVYYWSVVGKDALGNQTSAAAYPFSFSLAGGAVSAQSNDLAVASIDPSLTASPSPDQYMVDVTIKNQGGRPDSNVDVAVSVNGVSQGDQSLSSINPNDTKVLTFAVYLPKTQTGSGFLVSALLNGFSDDNMTNNSLTRQIPWPAGGSQATAKILGGVWLDNGDGTKKALGGASVNWSGPNNTGGQVACDDGGQYKIDSLPLGTYSLTATYGNYPQSPALTVPVTDSIAYASRDIVISAGSEAAGGQAGSAQGGNSFSAKSDADKQKVSDSVLKSVSGDVAKQLQGYKLDSIDAPGISDSDLADILNGLATGKVKITNASAQ